MITSLANTRYTQAIDTSGYEYKERRVTREVTAQGDVVSFSAAAYAALEAAQKNASQETQLSPTTEQGEKSLLDELKEYIKNPVLKHAMDKMEKAVADMGFDGTTSELVLDELKAAFRSGIPAEGQQTTDVLKNIRKNLKDNTGLPDETLSKLMKKVSEIVADAQREDRQRGTDNNMQQREKTLSSAAASQLFT